MKLAGIYIHIPFCCSRCSYCDFATGLYESALAERYVASVVSEIASWREVDRPETVDTIYFGGGTPSLLSPAQLEALMQAVRTRFDVSPNAEVTMEMNPGTVTPEALRAFRILGINRASFGAQTFDDRELARLGRSHSSDDTRRTFSLLREDGFDNVSFDLIAGLPGQTLSAWERNLAEAFALSPEHLSFYLLEVHEGTPLAAHIKKGLQPPPDEDLAAEMYQVMLERAAEAGYEHYEISNLCLPGCESRHNTKYWTGAPYYGFGCSAHSFDGASRRWANERDLSKYVAVVERNGSPLVEDRRLTEADRRAEAVFLGMRMMAGVRTNEFKELFGVDLGAVHADDLRNFQLAGLIEFDGDLLKLTRAGALLSNEVFAAFV
ncbi:MAG TPA: radical SAM family heme chaperone HemW [Pyrinomonadaceae bacterium]|nr:radical SAM family heme chaperone HemW [Pyrinomonadaceae bacterium]